MWKAIDGYEGYYEVSDAGEVRSLDRFVVNQTGKYKGMKRELVGKIMKQSESVGAGRDSGYLVVNLRKNHTANVVTVHKLVADAFIPNPLNLPSINHIDGNKHNNRVDNLERVSYSDNNIHAIKTGLRSPRGNPIAQYDQNHNLIAVYRSTCEAARVTGVSRGGISHCLNGRCETSGGYVWKKISESPTTIPEGSTREDELPVEAQRPSNRAEDIVCPVRNDG